MALNLKTKTLQTKVEVTPVEIPAVVPTKVLVQPQETSEIEALTDEYIELHKKMVYFEVKTMMKRMDDIRKQLVTVANETMDWTQPAVFASPKGEILFSERGKVVGAENPLALIQELLTKFGPEATSSVVDIAIMPLRKLLSEHELKNFLVETPGSRVLKTVRPT